MGFIDMQSGYYHSQSHCCCFLYVLSHIEYQCWSQRGSLWSQTCLQGLKDCFTNKTQFEACLLYQFESRVVGPSTGDLTNSFCGIRIGTMKKVPLIASQPTVPAPTKLQATLRNLAFPSMPQKRSSRNFTPRHTLIEVGLPRIERYRKLSGRKGKQCWLNQKRLQPCLLQYHPLRHSSSHQQRFPKMQEGSTRRYLHQLANYMVRRTQMAAQFSSFGALRPTFHSVSWLFWPPSIWHTFLGVIWLKTTLTRGVESLAALNVISQVWTRVMSVPKQSIA